MNDYVMTTLVRDRQGQLLAEATAHRLGTSARSAKTNGPATTTVGRSGPVRLGLARLLGRSPA